MNGSFGETATLRAFARTIYDTHKDTASTVVVLRVQYSPWRLGIREIARLVDCHGQSWLEEHDAGRDCYVTGYRDDARIAAGHGVSIEYPSGRIIEVREVTP